MFDRCLVQQRTIRSATDADPNGRMTSTQRRQFGFDSIECQSNGRLKNIFLVEKDQNISWKTNGERQRSISRLFNERKGLGARVSELIKMDRLAKEMKAKDKYHASRTGRSTSSIELAHEYNSKI